ncbi:MAG: zinc-finger-containing protein [Pseudomonadota bacterium]
MTALHPVTCPYCQQPAVLVGGDVMYPHRPDLADKKFWNCAPCKAFVGCHPAQTATQNGVGDGTVPMGRLANAELRRAKQAAHAAFDPLWKSGAMHRKAAYKWLSKALGLTSQQTHIGMFDVAQCVAVVAAVKARQA